jgi:hypothetical protein
MRTFILKTPFCSFQRGQLTAVERSRISVSTTSSVTSTTTMSAASTKTTAVAVSASTAAMAASMPQVEIPDEKDTRFSVLSYEQVKRLSDLMSGNISIHGRGNFPTIEVKLCDLVQVVKKRLEEDGVKVREIRLNGSGASSVLASSDSDPIAYNDLDLIFSVDLSTGKAYDRVKCAVLESLMHLLPEGVSRKRMSTCSLKEAYVSKMVKVNDSDRWSLITLGNNRTKSVELKFVDSMRRQYEFSVDSFHILLDTLFLFYECASATPIGDNFYPTVVAESMYGDYHSALYHLHKKLIATKNPEEIRGGGLLKYCNLLCKAFQPARPDEVKNMERYMCSRFFIDFSDVRQQQAKLENYLYNHFQCSEDRLKHEYLMILYQVVDESTVCLMGHERRLTLSLIEDLAFQIYCPPPEAGYYHPYHTMQPYEQHQQYMIPITPSTSATSTPNGSNPGSSAASTNGDDLSLLSPMSMSSDSGSSTSSSSSSTASNSGYTTPQKPATPGPVATTTTTVPLVQQAPPPPQQQQQQQLVPVSSSSTTPNNLIPTYEIVTSCQPAVVYSNGYYYTSFVPPNNSTVSISSGTTTLVSTCSSCSCQNPQGNMVCPGPVAAPHHPVSQWSVPPPPIQQQQQQQHKIKSVKQCR